MINVVVELSEREIHSYTAFMRGIVGHNRFLNQEELYNLAYLPIINEETFNAAIISHGNHYMLYLGQNKAYDSLRGNIVPVRDDELLNVVGGKFFEAFMKNEQDDCLDGLYVDLSVSKTPVQVEVSKFNKILPNYNLVNYAKNLNILQRGIDCGLYCLVLSKAFEKYMNFN